MTAATLGNSNIGWVELGIALVSGAGSYLVTRRFLGMDKPPVDPATAASNRFRLYDFLHSNVMPELAQYRVSSIQWGNAQYIAQNVLEPMWDRWGQVIITSGGRPVELKDSKGRGFFELLEERGFSPAQVSQHQDFSAVDVKLMKRAYFRSAFMWLMRHPAVRQVILYVDSNGYPRSMHIGIITGKWPEIKGGGKALLFTPETKYVAATPKEIQKRVQV